jgi:hypothetical protein
MSAVIPTDASLADINHAMQSAAESDVNHDDIQSAVVGGDFGGRDSNNRSQTGKSPSCAFRRTPLKPNPAF